MHTDYRSPVLRQLVDQQVRYAPRDKKLEQVNRVEKLMREVDPARSYSYEYLCYRITDFRAEATPHTVLSGADALHDLRLFVEDVSDAANVQPSEMAEKVLSVEDLSRMFNVSTKTISRWREQGLVSRRFVVDGRKRVGFLSSSVDCFVAGNRARVERGEKFSQLTDSEREEIVARARRLARSGACPSEVARRLARHFQRSVETIRYTLKRFDDEHPEFKIFPERSGQLNDETKRKIYQQYRLGSSVEELVKKHERTKTSIYRVLNEMRARHLLELPLDFVPAPDFQKPDADRVILAALPQAENPPRKTRVPAGLPPYLASLYETPLLTREQEYHLFRQYNYLKFTASRLRDALDPATARGPIMDRIEELYDTAVKIKNEIVQANLRLVVSIAKRHVNPADDFFELVSDGNMSLIRAVEKFDYTRGNKFSTYGSWAIMKNYARTIPDTFKQRDRFRTSHEEMFEAREDVRSDQYEQEAAQQTRESQIGRLLPRLDAREQKIIALRYGLDHSREPLTLKQVGEILGITKERVRQLEARGLAKLRQAAQEESIELPDLG